MERREFLATSLAASAVISAPSLMGAKEAPNALSREYYELRQYKLRRNEEVQLTDNYLREALVPALNRLDVKPVGVFNLTVGLEQPMMFVLMPCLSAETLLNVEERLMQDAEYTKAAADFLKAPVSNPAFGRIDSRFMRAFPKKPRMTLPAAAVAKSPRIYELRTYENPSIHDHIRKVEMMEAGETEIFTKYDFMQTFYSEMLIGPRRPNVTYMVGFKDLADRDAKWAAFFNSAEWKTLIANPLYSNMGIVSNLSNLFLTPTAYSQI
jgi:hypothetical protein